jgi:Tfp pilus assembly protein PilV
VRSTQAQGVPHALAVPLQPELSAEHGVTLVETIVAAAVLVADLLGVLASLDAASHTTAVNRGRTVAASLAEQDIERLRGLPTTTLATYGTATAKSVVGGTEYTVTSRAEWSHDASGTPASCDSDGRQADYIKVTSTVTSNVLGKRVKPVELTSIVAPRVGSFGANQGTLAVQVKNAAAEPVPGLPVSIAGPSAHLDTTNELGCAVFGHIPAGSYAVQLSRPGWVDRSGNQTVTEATTVASGAKSTVSLEYAQAAAVTVSFDTEVRGSKQGSTSPALTAANTGLPTGTRVFKPNGATASITATGLFPFPDGYTFFSGGCATAKPDQYVPDYFSTFPGFVKLGAGGSASVTVREPALNLRVTRGPNQQSFVPLKEAYVVITSASPGCSDRYVFDGVNPNGTLPEPGLPFGEYIVCADDRNVKNMAVPDRRYAKTSVILADKPEGLDHATEPKLELWIDPTSMTTRGYCT